MTKEVQYLDQEPILSVPDEEVGFFESLGYTVVGASLATEPEDGEEEETDAEEGSEDDLIGDPDPEVPDESYTVAQLTEFAANRGIDLKGASLKADILKTIQEALQEN